MDGRKSIVADRILVLLFCIAAAAWCKFFFHHQLELSAWIGLGCLSFLAFSVWRWGFETLYLPGLISGAGLGAAMAVACWKHRLYDVTAGIIAVWLLASIVWWLIAPVQKGKDS